MAHKPSVALIHTGGTIDSVGTSRLDLASYYETGQRLDAGELVESLPELADIADVVEVPLRRMSSYALRSGDWLELARRVNDLAADHDGVVVTHGTNTIEETAYFLHLTVRSPNPVVLVGAMRPASGLGTDGPLNLVRAVQVAAAPQARDHGVLVVLNDTVFSARDVTKTAVARVDAFAAPDLGPLGYADADGAVVLYHRHVRRPREAPPFDLSRTALPRVDVVVSYVDADGVMIDAAVAAGARGIVSAGTGAGRPTPDEEAALDRAVEAGVVVCQSTRVGAGRLPPAPGFLRRGLVTADNLQPWKARVLLALALTRTANPRRIQAMFDRW